MGKGLDRTQILRVDCNTCRGQGFIRSAVGEEMCTTCGGNGVIEREVPYKFESNGRWTKEEVAEAFEMPVDQVKDAGHSTGE